jgi:hypothetical protein
MIKKMFQRMDHCCASKPIPSCIIQPNGIKGKCGLAPWVSKIAVIHQSFKMTNKGILDSVENSSEILQEFIEKISEPTKK